MQAPGVTNSAAGLACKSAYLQTLRLMEHLGEEECRYLYGSLSRACQPLDGVGRVLALTRRT
jgi:hypothetical protein